MSGANAREQPPVIFETERLLVRRASPDSDLSALLGIFGDRRNIAHFGDGRPWSEDRIREFLSGYPHGDPCLAAVPGLALLKPALEPVGFGGVGYYVAPGNTADLFFIFRHELWGRGLATELARAAIKTAFGCAEIDVITASVKPANVASVRVLEKCGMVREGYAEGVDRFLYRLDRPDAGARERNKT